MEQHLHQTGLILRRLEPAIEFQAGFISKSGKALPRIAEMLIEKARELERDPTAV